MWYTLNINLDLNRKKVVLLAEDKDCFQDCAKNTNDAETYSEHKARSSRRGFCQQDTRWFSEEAMPILQRAQEETEWLINREYNINSVMELVGGKYQLSARQRIALKRSTSTREKREKRDSKKLPCSSAVNGPIYIDGFNLIITIEVALSNSVLLLGNDGNVRDIAGLMGSYRIIDKTDKAIELIGKVFEDIDVPSIKFFLDSPVSNSGKLKSKILQHAEKWCFPVEVELVPNADPILSKMGRIVTSDSIILDNCISWFNIAKKIIDDYIEDAVIINLSGNKL